MTPISLQLWSVRTNAAADFSATIAKVAKAGYDGVETAGYGNVDAATAAKAIADNGLKVSGMHVGIARLRTELTQVAVEAHALGSPHIICPFLPAALFNSAPACQALGEELNEIGARLRGLGFSFHYHNHAHEIAVVDGRLALDWLLDAAEPRNLGCQLDVYWSHVGGKPPADYIREQGRRIRLLHIKDEAELGSGPVEFPPIFKAAASVGAVEWHIVEVEKYNHDPLESARLSLETLRKWTSS
ncbi:MAG TPA: sugar phosphate isomerase/epimerase [Opitutaceae bacterium]|nr:sugar phosphate isomerase/epimerase [Opitutaceae bacterium]